MILSTNHSEFTDFYRILWLLTKCHRMKQYRMKYFIQFCSIPFYLLMNSFNLVPLTNFSLDSKIASLHHLGLYLSVIILNVVAPESLPEWSI
jgi:hypothetical protein